MHKINQPSVNRSSTDRQPSFPSWPSYAPDEIETVVKILQSGKVNYWTGNEGKTFEQEFANYIGKKYGVALANGTLALELALYALDIGPGDEVIIPSRTYFATASSVVTRGATPVIADIDPISGNLSASTVAQVITSRTRAIIPVHMAGWPCDMNPLQDLASKHNLYLVEDCAQAHGARYNGQRVGSFGICSAFSFCQDKIITTGGEGGILLTDDESIWRRAWEYKDHGKSWSAVSSKDHPAGFRWLHESFGSNWRMTEMQAGIGRCQLRKLSDWLTIRRRNSLQLAAGLRSVRGLITPMPPSNIEHAWYKFYTFIDLSCLKSDWNQPRVIDAINAEGIPCMSGTCSEIYREKAFTNLGCYRGLSTPVAQNYSKSSLMFHVHPNISELEISATIAAIRKVMAVAVSEV